MVTAQRAGYCLEAALAYSRMGWRITPIRPRSKSPFDPKWQQTGIATPEWIQSFWGEHDYGIGLVMGPIGPPELGYHIFALDIDDGVRERGGELVTCVGPTSLSVLELTYGKLPETVEAISGSGQGSRHKFFITTGNVPIECHGGNARDKGSVLGPDIDVKGVGGQVLAWPTLHMDTGLPYRWIDGHAPWDRDVAVAPAWLVELLTTRSNIGKPRELIAPPIDRTLPGDQWAATITWQQLLEENGATFGGGRNSHDGYIEYWTRPGKNVRDGISASLYYGGSDVLNVFTSTWSGLEQNRTYTKFGFLAATKFNGDHQAARQHLESLGFIDRTKEEVDRAVQYMLSIAPTFGNNRKINGEQVAAPIKDAYGINLEDWEPLLPIYDTEEVIPTFPIDVLPDWVKNYVEKLADRMCLSVDIAAMFAIGAVSMLAAGRLQVALAPTWQTDVNLYLMPICRSSRGKTPTFYAIWEPVYQIEREAAGSELERKLVAQRKKIAKEIAAKAMKGLNPEDDMSKVMKLVTDAEALPDGEVASWSTPDITSESALVLAMKNNGRLGVISDEGGNIVEILAGRYSSNGTGADLNPWLKGWDGKPYSQDRLSREKIKIDKLLVTLMLSVQPIVVSDLAKDARMGDRGLVPRIMFAFPPEPPTDPMKHFLLMTEEEQLEHLAADHRWIADVKSMWSVLKGRENAPLQCTATSSARRFYGKWINEYKVLTDDGGPLSHLNAWMSKMGDSVIRLAGLLWLIDGAQGPLDESHLKRSMLVGEYWISHARKVLEGQFTADTIAGEALSAIRVIREKKLGPRVRPLEIKRAVPRLPSTERAKTVLEFLAERGICKPVTASYRRGGSKTPDAWELRPGFFEHIHAKVDGK